MIRYITLQYVIIGYHNRNTQMKYLEKENINIGDNLFDAVHTYATLVSIFRRFEQNFRPNGETPRGNEILKHNLTEESGTQQNNNKLLRRW